MKKICTKCGEEKDISEFPNTKNKSHNKICKICWRKYHKNWRVMHIEQIHFFNKKCRDKRLKNGKAILYWKKYRIKNLEKLKLYDAQPQHRERRRLYLRTHPEVLKKSTHKYRNSFKGKKTEKIYYEKNKKKLTINYIRSCMHTKASCNDLKQYPDVIELKKAQILLYREIYNKN